MKFSSFFAFALVACTATACPDCEHEHVDLTSSTGVGTEPMKSFIVHYSQCASVPACDEQHCDFNTHGCFSVGQSPMCCANAETHEDESNDAKHVDDTTSSSSNSTNTSTRLTQSDDSNKESVITPIPSSSSSTATTTTNEEEINTVRYHGTLFDLLKNQLGDNSVAEINSSKERKKPNFEGKAPPPKPQRNSSKCTCKIDANTKKCVTCLTNAKPKKCVSGDSCCGNCNNSKSK